ncbi:hypothetical protein I6A60_37325 [Frankia sp. AgB1.9]|uniref:hypothetical protein n=1 Tax=unclassified Frankia TaxID=2632575 RepID=UPI001932943B|nr:MULTISPECIES: hypothetical protein [unclassified Frankia]MBL7493544.1 hypothetical protein [Frankia sp. AgW1.1]MBL7553464.1 hypothetical protein [Frankia sp. AgB1.9]MBL7622317.1 hypothetical protein [Frankia sp. AgB1.8]
MRCGSRFSTLERIWQAAGCSIAVAAGPAAMPSVEAVRHVLREFATLDPDSRFLRGIDLAGSRWVRIPPERCGEFLSRVVVELDDRFSALADPVEDDRLLMARLAMLCEAGLDDLPFRISVGQRYSIFEWPHLVSDRSAVGFWLGMLCCSVEHRRPDGLVETGSRYPLARALGWHLVRRPDRLLGIADRMRSQSGRPDGGPAGSEVPAVSGPVGRVVARSGPELVKALRAWRDSDAVGTSLHAVLFAATAAAADHCGLARATDGSWVPCDLRRYLKDGAPVYGNFAASSLLRPADPTSPRSVAAELRRALDLGEPLATLAKGLIGERLPRRRSSTPAVPAAPRPGVAHVFTAWGEPPDLGRLPWLAPPPQRFFACAFSQTNRCGVSYTYALLDGVLHVWAHFDENRYEATTVRQALDLLCTDPIALLLDRAGGLATAPRGRGRPSTLATAAPDPRTSDLTAQPPAPTARTPGSP